MSETIVQVEDVYKAYRGLLSGNPVLTGASLHVRRGEIVGLMGENGSGKTTLMKIIVGTLDYDRGEVKTVGDIGYCPRSRCSTIANC